MTISPVDLSQIFKLAADEPAREERRADLRRTLALLWRGKWIIAGGAAIGLALAAAYIASVAPTYTAVSTVLYAPDERRILNLDEVLDRNAERGLRDQIEILRSTGLMTRVVEVLRLHQAGQFAPSGARGGEGHALFGLGRLVPRAFLANIGLSRAPDAGITLDGADPAIGAARNRLMAATDFVSIPDSRVIKIRVTTGHPVLSARIANEIARQYITATLDAKLAATREATRWLNARVDELRADLNTAEAAVSDHIARAAERAGQSPVIMRQQLAALNEAYAAASARRSTAQIRHRLAADAMADTDRIAGLAEFQSSAAIGRYREDELALLGDRTQLAKLVPEGHERLAAIDVRIAHVRSNLRVEADRIVGALAGELEVARAEEAAFADKIRAMERQLQRQDHELIAARQLEREAEASRQIYESFLRRLKETTQEEKLEAADAMILSPSEPPEWADSAAKKRGLAMGGIAGALLGLAMVMLVERLNATFRTVDEIQAETGLAMLGAIPALGRDLARNDIVGHVLDRPNSALAEAVRSMRTSLLFSRIDDPPKVVMFTSTVPEEGKSTTSLLLALTSAQMGKSAIIVDCDLRRPSLHLGLLEAEASEVGLREVLEGTVPLEAACRQDEDTGLHVLTCHSQHALATNAADILASERFGTILETLRARFDLVILDAPPVLSVTDARIVAPRVDAVMYCVRWDHTAREAVHEGLRELTLVEAKVAGLVVTQIDAARAARYGYAGPYRSAEGDRYYDG
ncbi:polysaccharide biosynthesis tyrosine autokinase [Acuticoccus kandeliae]|uniref:polysaccharide biosynthesis tyrosine autokinase n=1 Tax=Acuticoccus kandeliae TaxID=2073160 RepID=UPI0014759D3E|nr:polysaccharide biosynthesis tyrosine autokinase [Acuticoccus kandeliae]